MNKISLMIAVGFGTTIASFALISQPVDAANLRNGGTDESAFIFDNNITKIGEVEGQAGGISKEIFFGFNGASTGRPQSSIDLKWIDEKIYDWTLNWNPSTNAATFTVQDNIGTIGRLDYTFASNVLDRFNAFGLITRADAPSSQIGAKSTIELAIDNISFSDNTTRKRNKSVKSTSGRRQFDKQFYVLSDRDRQRGVEITSLSGTFSMDWNAINPQKQNAGSRVAFEIKMFDPPISNLNNAPSVVEPAQIPEFSLRLGILGLGVLGMTCRLWNSIRARSSALVDR